MKKTTIAAVLLLAFSLQALVQACKKDDEPSEYIADNNTFARFWDFYPHDTLTGPDPILGSAHSGNDANAQRLIYFKDDAERSGSEYPVGTVIVKHVTNPGAGLNDVFAMVKRGADYDPTGNDWEYFLLQSDGTIKKDTADMELRGFDLAGGACKSCHSVTAGTDFVFSK